jgi:Leucine-rich repeat (LRR) protein
MKTRNVFVSLALFVFGSALTAFAQGGSDVIRIPDLKLRAYLLANAVDANGDKQIQRSEAQDVEALDLNELGIRNPEGLQHFTGLKILNIEHNLLTALDVSALKNLERLSVLDNQLTRLDVRPLKKLRELDARRNRLSELLMEDLPALELLYVTQNKELTRLSLSGLPALKTFAATYTSLTALDLRGLSRLAEIEVIGLEGNAPSLEDLRFGGNDALHTVVVRRANVAQLDVSGLPKLRVLRASECGIKEVNVSRTPALEEVELDSNPIQSADFMQSPRLRVLSMQNVPTLRSLHVRGLRNLEELNCYLLLEPRIYLPLNLSGTVRLRKLVW